MRLIVNNGSSKVYLSYSWIINKSKAQYDLIITDERGRIEAFFSVSSDYTVINFILINGCYASAIYYENQMTKAVEILNKKLKKEEDEGAK